MAPKVIVLGSTGMLGQQVVQTFRREGEPILAFSRTAKDGSAFTFSGQSAEEVSEQLSITPGDYVINCIGWIPQVATGKLDDDSARAKLLNIELPVALEKIAKKIGVRVLQVSTDCVFSGRHGRYTESSTKDATDLYGLTKIEGEENQPSSMRIRASIVGPDENSSTGLFSWFLSQTGQPIVTGYTDHIWTGVTTLAMSKLFLGIIRTNAFESGCFHWVPSDQVSKFELLRLFGEKLSSNTPAVVPGLGPKPVDRSLMTDNPQMNKKLWTIAGYSEVPTIESLVSELISSHEQKSGHSK